METRFKKMMVIVVITVLNGWGTSSAGAASFTSLGDFSGGIYGSQVQDVSADGTTVVGSSAIVPLQDEAFRWTSAEGMVGLGDLPEGSFRSIARGVSADGSTIVGSGSSAAGREAFRWTSAEGMVGLGDLPGGVLAA